MAVPDFEGLWNPGQTEKRRVFMSVGGHGFDLGRAEIFQELAVLSDGGRSGLPLRLADIVRP